MNNHIGQPDPYAARRQQMVIHQIAGRGIGAAPVLQAMSKVPREEFLPPSMQEFAYEDSPLPIAEGQTISQPYIVAYMIDALQLEGGERVLEIGTGSGYAACVLAEVAAQVYTIERHEALARRARDLIARLGYDNVEVIQGDGTLGWPDAAPYDGIVVTAGGPAVPAALKRQLAPGGRMVIPVGAHESRQMLVRVSRTGEDQYTEQRLADVRFVPLVGEQGWGDPTASATEAAGQTTAPCAQALAADIRTRGRPETPELIAAAAERLTDVETGNIDRLMGRIGDARIVLIGEASHGTSEFYRFRARITRRLIEEKQFSAVAIEADWPDASRIDHYVRHIDAPPAEWTAFARFPTWMWRNREMREFVDWLHHRNGTIDQVARRVSVHGLDLYSLFDSIAEVLNYLDRQDPEAARVARERYGCLTPWQADPATYGRAAASGRWRSCRDVVAAMLADLLKKRAQYLGGVDGTGFLNAVQNARLVANAEEYYRSMYEGYSDSWNLRDSHMFETLQALLQHGGERARIVVWAHNSHLGDASATDMAARGQHNLGQLCRQAYGDATYLIGFGCHTGTVAAASDWGGVVEFKRIRPSLTGSWERLCHDSEVPVFTLGLRELRPEVLSERLHEQRLQRAIGVIYRPETERASHYFAARLASQFDEYIWFDETRAVTPLATADLAGTPDTYPFGV